MSRAKNWVFTLNNPEEAIYLADIEGLTYGVFQYEMGEEGTFHAQGLLMFNTRLRMSQLKSVGGGVLSRAHLEVCQDIQGSIDYCTKEESRIEAGEEYGERPKHTQGKRNDLLAVVAAVKEGKRFHQMIDDSTLVAPIARHMKFVERLEKEFLKPVDRSDIIVTLHIGSAGSGKTDCACPDRNRNHPDVFFYDGGFWEGYTNQRILIFDEMSGATCTPLTFQRICDKSPYTCNIKGHSAPLAATEVHITTNFMPSSWWSERTKFNREAIWRRIHVVHHHYEFKKYKIYRSDENGYALDKYIGDSFKRSSTDQVIVGDLVM